jgi:membrane associated rhomboid family serine protease
MLEDRDYMRAPDYSGGRWSMTTILLISYASIFLLEVLMSPLPGTLRPDNAFFNRYLALSLDGIKHGYVWQLLTYQFLHGSLMHLFGNCLAIFFFGREMEILLGWKRYLVLLLGSGVVGGLCQMLAALAWPSSWYFSNNFAGSVVGASAGAFGLIAAFATLYPDRELMMLLFFIIPIRMRARTLLALLATVALLGLMFSDSILGGNIAHVAHLGGMIAGIFYVRQIMQGRWFQFKNPLRRSEPRPMVTASAGRKSIWGASRERLAEEPTEQFMKNEVDPILDKITAHGIHSLTDRERKILETARKKINRP